MMLNFHFRVNYFTVNRFLFFGLPDTFICSIYGGLWNYLKKSGREFLQCLPGC